MYNFIFRIKVLNFYDNSASPRLTRFWSNCRSCHVVCIIHIRMSCRLRFSRTALKKCYRLGITYRTIPSTFQYLVNNQPIYRVSSANLCWNEHINNICKKANSTLGLLRRILSGCDSSVKDAAFRTLARPKLEYACCAWNPFTKQNINQIEMVQRRAARFLFNDYSRFSLVAPMIEQLGWDSLKNRRLLFQASIFYKILMGYIGISFPPELHEITRATRLSNSRPFKQISVSNNVYKYSFYPRTIVT